MRTITGKSVREELETAMHGLAARHFARLNPRASKQAAWRFAVEHAEEFREQALQFLTMAYLERETAAEAIARVN